MTINAGLSIAHFYGKLLGTGSTEKQKLSLRREVLQQEMTLAAEFSQPGERSTKELRLVFIKTPAFKNKIQNAQRQHSYQQDKS